jgi:hypothetical protein
VSTYRVAIDQTTKTIDSRAKYFRNLIVVVVAVGLGSIGWAGIARAFWPLAGLFLVVPTCGVFFSMDARLLNNWRSYLFDAWVTKEINFQSFREAVRVIPTLPKDTIHSMLETLPKPQDLIAEQRISSSTREAATAAVTEIHGYQSDIVAVKAVASAVASGSLVIAVASRTWQPLLGGGAFILLPILRKWLKWRRIDVLKERMVAVRAKPDFSDEKYRELVARLQWDPTSKSEKDDLLNRLNLGRS